MTTVPLSTRTLFPLTDEAVQYLAETCRFHFTDAPELEPIEFYVIQLARELMSARRELIHVAQKMAEDASYVADSLSRADERSYVPPSRVAVEPLAELYNEMARDLRELAKAVTETQRKVAAGSLANAEQRMRDYLESDTAE